MSEVPEVELKLPANTPDEPHPTAFVVHNPNVSNRQIHLNFTSTHSVPINLPAYPFPKEDFVDYNKYQPESFNDGIALKDEYLQIKFDDKGEKKISKNGYLTEETKNSRIVVSTFTLPGRGKKLYVMATDISKELQFRDSYLFLNKNKSLVKYVTNEADKLFLIKQGILQSVFKSRVIGVITFRSLYLIYGARLISEGKRVVDDYWEELAVAEEFSPSDPVYNLLNLEMNLGSGDGNDGGSGGSGGDIGEKGLRLMGKSDLLRLNKRFEENQGFIGDGAMGDFTGNTNVPIPVNVENHPFINNTRFRLHRQKHYRLNYDQKKHLDQLILPEPSTELKQNYLLSSGIANTTILNRPLYSVNGQVPHPRPVEITSPGGSVPPSITLSLLNNDSLTSSNGDNIYWVTCLQGEGITGTVNLSKNIVTPNYRLNPHGNRVEKSKLDELATSIPVTANPKLLDRRSHVGLKFSTLKNVVSHICDIENAPKAEPVAKQLVSSQNRLVLDGRESSTEQLRSLEYLHNAVSANQNINNYRNLRLSQWKYYWFQRSGGYNLTKKNLKRKLAAEKPKPDSGPIRGELFDYQLGGDKSEENVVTIDLNENSDEEVLEEKSMPLPMNYQFSNQDKHDLYRQKGQIVTQFQMAHPEANHMDLGKLQFQQLLTAKTIKRKKPNSNSLIDVRLMTVSLL